jgi:uncharacterized OB-fold protein
VQSIADFENNIRKGNLVGYACSRCGHKGLTFTLLCPRCRSEKLTSFTFRGGGSVRTYTLLSVPSEKFVKDAPYAYVVVDLDEGGSTSGWMPDIHSPSEISIGDRVVFAGRGTKGITFKKESK